MCVQMMGHWFCGGNTHMYVAWAEDRWTRTYVACVPPEVKECPDPPQFDTQWILKVHRHEYDCPASACCQGEGVPVCKPPPEPHKISDTTTYTYDDHICVCP